MSEQTGTCSKKVRGRAQRSITLIEAMYAAAEKANPITGRGIGYKLFTAGLIPSMARNEMQRVYRLLKEAREDGLISWDWIVDETRGIERVSTWDDPDDYARCVARSYRRDFWNQQPHRVQAWSEKGTVCSPRCSIAMPSALTRCMGSTVLPTPIPPPRTKTVAL